GRPPDAAHRAGRLAGRRPPGGPGRRQHRRPVPDHLSWLGRGGRSVTAAIEATGLGKRYGRRRWALRGCPLSVPAGRVVGLGGANGAGKSTLMHLAVGLLRPTAGRIDVLGAPPAAGPDHLAGVAFVVQDPPLSPGLSVAAPLRLGRGLHT